MIEAQPYKGGRKGADGGVDGLLYFKPDGRTTEKAIVEVKGGENVSPQWVRALGQVVERERAKIGVLVTLADPTVTMRREAAAAGLYKTEYGSFAKLQILTVEDLFNGQRPAHALDRPERVQARQAGEHDEAGRARDLSGASLTRSGPTLTGVWDKSEGARSRASRRQAP